MKYNLSMSYLNHQMIIMHKYFNVPRVKHSCYEATTKNNTFYHSIILSVLIPQSQSISYEERRYCSYSSNTCIRTQHINRMESCTPRTQYSSNSSSMFLPKTSFKTQFFISILILFQCLAVSLPREYFPAKSFRRRKVQLMMMIIIMYIGYIKCVWIDQ